MTQNWFRLQVRDVPSFQKYRLSHSSSGGDLTTAAMALSCAERVVTDNCNIESTDSLNTSSTNDLATPCARHKCHTLHGHMPRELFYQTTGHGMPAGKCTPSSSALVHGGSHLRARRASVLPHSHGASVTPFRRVTSHFPARAPQWGTPAMSDLSPTLPPLLSFTSRQCREVGRAP